MGSHRNPCSYTEAGSNKSPLNRESQLVKRSTEKGGEEKLYFARMSVWTFKKGQREKGLAVLENRISSKARRTEGFRGYMQLLSEEAVDCATMITLWKTEAARSASSKGVFKDAIQTLDEYAECPPVVTNLKMSDVEIRV